MTGAGSPRGPRGGPPRGRPRGAARPGRRGPAPGARRRALAAAERRCARGGSAPGGGRWWWWLGAWLLVLVVLLTLLRSVMAILLVSVALAWLLDPLVDRYEARGHSRELAIAFIYTLAALGSFALVLLVVQLTAREFQGLAARLADAIHGLPARVEALLPRIEELVGRWVDLDEEAWSERVRAWAQGGAGGLASTLQGLAPGAGRWLGAALRHVLDRGAGALGLAVNLALVPLFTFYAARDWDRAIAAIDELVPTRARATVRRLAREVDRRLGAFVRGQLTVCLVLAVLYSVGLLLVGVDLAIVIGVSAGLLFIIPYFGTIVGVVLGSLMALFESGLSWQLVGVWAVFGAVQALEGSVLTPRIVGESVGLHPMVVILAILVGGNLWGVAGMLLAVPVAAVLHVLLAEWLERYRASAAFEE